MNTYTPYQQRIRQCFADAYNFLDGHKNPRSNEDWKRIAADTNPYSDPLTVDLIVACLCELEREYKNNKGD